MSGFPIKSIEIDPAIADLVESAVVFPDKRNPPLCFIVGCKLLELGWCTGAESREVTLSDGNTSRENVAWTTIPDGDTFSQVQEEQRASCLENKLMFIPIGLINQGDEVVDAEGWTDVDEVVRFLEE